MAMPNALHHARDLVALRQIGRQRLGLRAKFSEPYIEPTTIAARQPSTCAPAALNRRAVARPISLLAPVTRWQSCQKESVSVVNPLRDLLSQHT